MNIVCIKKFDFLISYKNLSDAVHIKPKGHYLVHYSSQYKRFGPLIDYSTLRFEGKHSNSKSIFGTFKNFRNPCLTIATRHQYLQKLYHLNEEYLIEEKTDFQKKSADTLISILDKDLRRLRQLNLVDCESDSITLLTTVEYNEITYSKGSAVVLDCTDETISFALIENITYIKGSIYFILFGLNSLEFSEHLHGYVLMKTDNFLLKKINDLISSYPLSVYTSETGDKSNLFASFYQSSLGMYEYLVQFKENKFSLIINEKKELEILICEKLVRYGVTLAPRDMKLEVLHPKFNVYCEMDPLPDEGMLLVTERQPLTR